MWELCFFYVAAEKKRAKYFLFHVMSSTFHIVSHQLSISSVNNPDDPHSAAKQMDAFTAQEVEQSDRKCTVKKRKKSHNYACSHR